MKNIKMILTGTCFTVIFITGFYSCNIEEYNDPNNPSLEAIEADATIDEMNNLVYGIEAGIRSELIRYIDDCGMIGREYYYFSGADPRFTSDLLGKGEAVIDANTFYLTNPWSAHYRVTRNCWILRHAVENTSAAITAEETNGYNGFAKTMQAYMLLLNLNLTYENGVRIDNEDPENMGPIVTGYHEALSEIIAILDAGYDDLNAAGDAFLFSLSSGFAGSETPAGFAKFNRALKARMEVYHGDYAAAQTALTQSFFTIGGDLNTGIYHIYSAAAGDVLNDLFLPQNSSPGGNARCAHNSYVTDAEAGDLRLAKAPARDEVAFTDDLSSDYDVFIYTSNTDQVCIIRNEELLLLHAEIEAQLGNPTGAVDAINIIRSASGLAAYSGGSSLDDLINEILNQKRYALFAEGHRWIDMRRYGKLGELPIDRVGDDVFDRFPIPLDEI